MITDEKRIERLSMIDKAVNLAASARQLQLSADGEVAIDLIDELISDLADGLDTMDCEKWTEMLLCISLALLGSMSCISD